MVYSNKLVAVIKVNGKVLREDSGTVTIPFGSEYSILLKNLNTVKAMVKISVDGQDITEGTWLVIYPNSDLELERFIKNGNLKSGNKLKFIERTQEIEDHRGIKAEDGLVRVEYKFERRVQEVPITRYHYYDEYIPRWNFCGTPYRQTGTITYTSNNTGGCFTNTVGIATSDCAFMQKAAQCISAVNLVETERNDSGITVAGSESNQSFTTTSWFDTETSDVLVIKLKGAVDGKAVLAPVVVQHNINCSTCGKSNKNSFKFCSQCGTSLVII